VLCFGVTILELILSFAVLSILTFFLQGFQKAFIISIIEPLRYSELNSVSLRGMIDDQNNRAMDETRESEIKRK
jgi:hypothetical protein